MSKRLAFSIISIFATALPASALTIAVDIAPVHSLVAQVVGKAHSVELLVPSSADPHHAALKPSQARALSTADLVVRVSDEFVPWLSGDLAALAQNAKFVDLSTVAGTTTRPVRDDDHGAHVDPHLWLDVSNAKVWTLMLADLMSELDPANAGTFQTNAQKSIGQLTALDEDLADILASARGAGYIASHDSYQYVEARYGLKFVGAVSDTHAHDPGPSHLKHLRDDLLSGEAHCVLLEAADENSHVQTVVAGSEVPVVVADPLGRDLTSGPHFYAQLLRNLGQSIADCVASRS